jgi:hypothetical protein
MPKQKDLKRLVRARMQKTGESYTAARAQLLKKQAVKSARANTASAASGAKPTSARTTAPEPSEYAKLAGMSDAVIKAKTGCNWERWVKALDHHGALQMRHRDIAELVHTKYKVPEWWTQAVTVGYERIRGLREVGQRRDGSYEANKSKTIPAPIAAVFEAFHRAPIRKRWLPVDMKVRTAVSEKSMRITWEDGTSVEAYFVKKAAGKTQVTIQHSKLSDRAAIDRWKGYWSERLSALAALVAE